jgi:hypothetical protein
LLLPVYWSPETTNVPTRAVGCWPVPAAAAQLEALQQKLQQRDADVSGLQWQAALMQAQLREAQRAGQAAAEAQAAAGKALDGQAAELAALRQQLKEAEVGVTCVICVLGSERLSHRRSASCSHGMYTQWACSADHGQLLWAATICLLVCARPSASAW